jgi:hypothetical protein
MLDKIVINFKKKSLKERFLLVIRILFFLIYLAFGLIIIFWKKLPIAMSYNYRVAFGLLLIVYSFFRFIRFFNSNEE